MITRNVDVHGRIVLPASLRRKLKISKGDMLDYYVEGNQIIIMKEKNDKEFYPTQLFISNIPPSPNLIQPIKNLPYMNKAKGGLWTSSLIDGDSSDWEIQAKEMFGEDKKARKFKLIPNNNVNVYTIDSLSDLMKLPFIDYNQIYPTKSLDFEQISNIYDGIHLTLDGQWRTRNPFPINLYGWDCECTFWFRWCFKNVLEVTNET